METFKKINPSAFVMGLWFILTGCSGQSGKDISHNINDNVELTQANEPYETAIFYKIDFRRDEYVPVKKVMYYVNGDTLFTSERYRTFSMYFSDIDADSIVNMNYIAFDLNQKPNKDGWYFITLGQYKGHPKDYYRLPNTRLRAVVLRAYYTGEPDSMYSPVASAVLFNGTKTMAQSPERNKLDIELRKLLPYID